MDTRECHYRYNISSSLGASKSRQLMSDENKFPSKGKLFKKSSKVLKNDYLIKTGFGILLFVTFLFSYIRYIFLLDVKCASHPSRENGVHTIPTNNVNSDPVLPENVTVINKWDCSKCLNNPNPANREEKTTPSSVKKVESTTKKLRSSISSSIKSQLANSELIWKRSVQQRREWISTTIGKNNLSAVNPWDGENYVFFWNYFPPSFNCPHSVERIGFIGDGGKWICGMEKYEKTSSQRMRSKSGGGKPCIIYSFGVANESSFEGEMLNRTDCLVYAYDYSVKSIGTPVESTNPRVTFKALGIGNKNLGKFRTLKYLMEQNGHGWIDILKMDIEGGEYAALDKVMDDFPSPEKHLPFGQLLLEVHVEGKIFPKFLKWWERLEERGLRAFQSEVNHVACAIGGAKPNFVEYSFINIRGKHKLVT